jgi:hypothetical protein
VQKGENSVLIQRKRRSPQSAGRSFGYARGLGSQGAPVAELIRRAIDVYLEQRKAEIKNA